MSNNSQAVNCPECISRISTLRLGVGAVGLLVGLFAAMGLLTTGHAAFNTSSNLVWGLPVVAYVFFTLVSTGLSFIASLAMVFGMKDFYPIAKRCIWAAIITLIVGFISLGLEMGNPLRMLWTIPFNMAVSSPMWWMGLFYTTCLVLLILKFLL
ncbi:MAG: NrfD/PsrC family molybdoenzyme membrane anchor subunit, partial [Sulfuricella sp.]|nr:NrfD/PsrC family molybdoenzyme membrane anchor subunit [Sulfuricella sp.]